MAVWRAAERLVGAARMTSEHTNLPDAVLRMARLAESQRRLYSANPETPDEDIPLGETVDDGEPAPRPDEGETIDQEVVYYCAGLDHSDTDNGERMRRHFGRDLLVVTQEKAKEPLYAVWTGSHWDVQNGGPKAHAIAQRLGGRIALEARVIKPTEVQKAAIEAAAEFRRKDWSKLSQEEKNLVSAAEKAEEAHSKRVKRRLDHAVSSKNVARIAGALKCLSPHIMRAPDDFNADDFKFACANATVSFARRIARRANPAFRSEAETPNVPRVLDKCEGVEVKARRGHDRDDLITHLIPVRYDPKADCPNWRRFIAFVQPEEAVRLLVQISAGLGLLGVTVQKLFFHYGYGANGKSVFMEVICRLFDHSAVTLPATSFVGENGNSGGASPDLARLYGRRLLRVKELPEGEQLKESLVKEVTGGEMVTARDLFTGYMDFKPHFTPHMSGNGYPKIAGTDNGIWRRMAVVPWKVTIPDAEQREFEEMVESFRPEFPGILNWLIEGVKIFLVDGLVIPEAVEKATQEYRDDMDRTAGFIKRRIIRDENARPVQSKVLYDAYKEDCEEQGITHPLSHQAFGKIMKKKFHHVEGRVSFYHGLAIVSGGNWPQRGQDERYPPPFDDDPFPVTP